MAKADGIELQGKVVDVLTGGKFKVKLENGHEITAYISGKIRKNYIRVIEWDKVDIVMSPYDLTQGRITYRHK